MRILWLKTELLHPVDKGGKIRTYQMLRELMRDHRVTYLTLDDGNAGGRAAAQAAEYCHDLIPIPHHPPAKFSPGFYRDLVRNLVTPLPYALSRYRSGEMERAIERCCAGNAYDLIVCDFLTPAINMPSGITTPTVLFQHNVEAMIWKRHYEVANHPVKRWFFRQQWQRMAAAERNACHRFDQVVAVSEEDAETMRREYGVDRISAVPTGVDTEFFRPRKMAHPEPNSLIFVGSMDWLPNDDAIRYFTAEILPRVRRRVPTASLTVVGRNPYPGLVEQGQRENIRVTGRVDDVRPYIEEAAVYVVPLRIGGGTRIKIYEAMAMEKPIVSTTIGAEGLPVRDGEQLILADDPDAFADAIVRLLNSETLREHIGRQAAAMVREKCSWRSATSEFVRACETAVQFAATRRHAAVGSSSIASEMAVRMEAER